MKWGIDDCVTDLFGAGAHQKISWLKDSHKETVLWLLSLSEKERGDLIRFTFQGMGSIQVKSAEPGVAAVGNFFIVGNADYVLPKPWFAKMGVDCHWYVRIPSGFRIVDFVGDLELYKCPH